MPSSRTAVKEIAWAKGRAVTFMAKYDARAAGSSSHLHQSLRTLDGKPAFFDPGEPHGMSRLMRQLRRGAARRTPAQSTYFLAPYVNSYKRFVAGTFAPTKAVWSSDNRTAGYRLVGADSPSVRIECRVGGADLNPYLAYRRADRRRHRRASSAGWSSSPSSAATPMPPRAAARDPEDAARRHRGAAPLEDAARGLRRGGGRALRARRALGAGASATAGVTDWEVARGFERA